MYVTWSLSASCAVQGRTNAACAWMRWSSPPATIVHPCTGWVKPRKRRTQQNHNGLCHPTLKVDTLRLIHPTFPNYWVEIFQQVDCYHFSHFPDWYCKLSLLANPTTTRSVPVLLDRGK